MISRDGSLVRSTLGGDIRAFEKLVARYQGAVFGVVVEIVRDTETARDLAQEAFLQAYTRLETLRDPGQFSSWLYRIARNLSLSWLRRPQAISFEEARDAKGSGATERAYDGRTPDALYEEQEMKRAVWNALDMLPEELRAVVVLRHLEEMRVADAGGGSGGSALPAECSGARGAAAVLWSRWSGGMYTGGDRGTIWAYPGAHSSDQESSVGETPVLSVRPSIGIVSGT